MLVVLDGLVCCKTIIIYLEYCSAEITLEIVTSDLISIDWKIRN